MIVVATLRGHGTRVNSDAVFAIPSTRLTAVVPVLASGDSIESTPKCEVGTKDSGYPTLGYGGTPDCTDSSMVVALAPVRPPPSAPRMSQWKATRRAPLGTRSCLLPYRAHPLLRTNPATLGPFGAAAPVPSAL